MAGITEKSLRSHFETVAFLSTIMVVMCHVDDWMDKGNFFIRCLGGCFTDSNVYNFFFLSGYFLAGRFEDSHWYADAIKKRVRTLLVPFVIWNVLYLVVFALAGGGGYDFKSVFGFNFYGPIDFPLWYVESLMLFILVSPLMRHLSNKRSAIVVGAVASLVVWEFLVSGPFHMLRQPYVAGVKFPILGFACFLLGAHVHRSDKNRVRWFATAKWSLFMWLAGWIVAACGFTVVPNAYGFVRPVYILLTVFALHRIVANINWRVPAYLSCSCFMIYASHWVIIKLLARGIDLKSMQGVGYVTIVVSVSAIGVMVTSLGRKIAPRLLSVVTGGRG